MEIAHRDDLTPEQRAQWDATCTAMVQAMTDWCRPCITSISEELSATEGQLQGSGSYLEIAGRRWLLSNEHVLKQWQTKQFTHAFDDCDEIYRLLGQPRALEKYPLDAALWEIPDAVWNMHAHQSFPVPEALLAQRHAPVDGEMLFLCGYPQERSHFHFGTLSNTAVPLLTHELRAPPVDDLHPNYVFLGYSPEHALRVNPHGAWLSVAPGLSGSLVWNTRLFECINQGQAWSPDLARVTGMIVRSDTPVVALQMLRVEVLRGFLARHTP